MCLSQDEIDNKEIRIVKVRTIVNSIALVIALLIVIKISLSLISHLGVFQGRIFHELEFPSMLHLAVKNGDIGEVKKWIKSGKNLDIFYNDPPPGFHGSRAYQKVAPLMFAIGGDGSFLAGNLEMVELLVEGGANIYAESYLFNSEKSKSSIIIQAVKAGDPQIFKYLWEKLDDDTRERELKRVFNTAFSPVCSSFHNSRIDVLNYIIDELLGVEQAGELARETVDNSSLCWQVRSVVMRHGVSSDEEALAEAAALKRPGILDFYQSRVGKGASSSIIME